MEIGDYLVRNQHILRIFEIFLISSGRIGINEVVKVAMECGYSAVL